MSQYQIEKYVEISQILQISFGKIVQDCKKDISQ